MFKTRGGSKAVWTMLKKTALLVFDGFPISKLFILIPTLLRAFSASAKLETVYNIFFDSVYNLANIYKSVPYYAIGQSVSLRRSSSSQTLDLYLSSQPRSQRNIVHQCNHTSNVRLANKVSIDLKVNKTHFNRSILNEPEIVRNVIQSVTRKFLKLTFLSS